jgi:hypothetical protein
MESANSAKGVALATQVSDAWPAFAHAGDPGACPARRRGRPDAAASATLG